MTINRILVEFKCKICVRCKSSSCSINRTHIELKWREGNVCMIALIILDYTLNSSKFFLESL